MKPSKPLLIMFVVLCVVGGFEQSAFPNTTPDPRKPTAQKSGNPHLTQQRPSRLRFSAVAPLLDEAWIHFLKAKALEPNLPVPAWLTVSAPTPVTQQRGGDRNAVLAGFAASPSKEFKIALNDLIVRSPTDREVRVALHTIAEMDGDTAQVARHDSILHPRQLGQERPLTDWVGVALKLFLIGLLLWQAKALIHDLNKKDPKLSFPILSCVPLFGPLPIQENVTWLPRPRRARFSRLSNAGSSTV